VCGCQKNKAQAVADGQTQWKIVYRDGTTDNKTYSTQLDAQVARQRSGRTGEVVRA
jgi:hypothetical protein